MPAVNGVGEPCAGEPHARFEVAGAGNGARNQVMVTGVAQPTGKPAEHEGPRTYHPAKQPRQPPTLLHLPEFWLTRLAEVHACSPFRPSPCL
jgi:hypothetical protein